MLGFLNWIVSLFELGFDLIVNMIQSLVQMMLIIQNSLGLPSILTSYVPPIIGASIMSVVGIGLCKLLLGWGNS